MSIESPVGTLDIKNATLRVGKLEVSNIQGIDTALNFTRANSVLIYDDQASTTTFTGTTSSAGVRDTVNGYLDVADGYVYWGQKLPNSWVMDFEMDIRSGTNAGSLNLNVFSSINTGSDGYSIVFDDNGDNIILKYDGATIATAAVSGLFTASENWQKVVINYERGMIAISLGGERKLYFQDIERETPYTTGEYINFSSASVDGRKIRDLKITNGSKWIYAGESNVVYTQGSVGVGVTDPTTALDVSGTVKATALEGDGSAITNISSANVGDFASNVTRIETLETDLSSNATRVSTLETDLGSNVTRIGTLETGNMTISGQKTFSGDVIFESNVHMQGDVFVANTVNMTVSDPIIELGSNNLNTGDLGIIMTRHGATNSNIAIVFDESADVLRMGYTLGGASDADITLDSNVLAVSVQGALTAASVSGDGSAITNISSANVGDFASNVTRIGTLETDLTSNVGRIGTLETDLTSNVGRIGTLETDLTSNVTRITNLESSDMTIGGEKTFSSNLQVGTADLFVNTTTGRVGIGTASPQYKLDVDGGTTEGDGDIMLRMFGAVNKVGKLIFGRTGTTDIRSHAIESITNAGGANNYMKFMVHDGGNSPPYETRTEVMTLLGDGNVGIGTASPAFKLDIHGTSNVGALTATSEVLTLRSDTGTSNAVALTIQNFSSDYTQIASGFGSRIQFTTNRGTEAGQASKSADIKGYIYSGAGGLSDYHALDLDVYGDNTSFSRGISIYGKGYGSTILPADVTVHGNLGIGTTSPAYKLDVHGTSNVGALTATSGTFSGDLAVGTSKLFVDVSTGNVGIGTTSPIARLDINGGAETGTTPVLALRGGLQTESDLYVLNTYGTNTGVGYAAKVIGVNIKNKVETNNTVKLRSNTGGVTSAGAIYLGSDDVNQGIFGVLGGTGATGTTLSEHLTVRASGNVGIGTGSPGQKLEVGHYGGALSSDFGAIRITNHATNLHATSLARFDISLGDIASGTGSGKRKLIFNSKTTTTDSGTDILCLDGESNNVGIGTTSPLQKLHVTDHIHVHQADTGVATLSAYGDSQGTGRLYVGQSSAYGGGIEYNGDNSPASTGAGADKITLYRVSNGTYSWTARNSYSSNDWEFRGTVTAPTFSGNATTATTATSVSGGTAVIGTNPSQDDSFDYSDIPLQAHYNSTVTSNTILNDPKSVMMLTREGTSGEAYGAGAAFRLSRWENSGTSSRSRLDIALTDNSFDLTNIMTMRSNGNVGIGTPNPNTELDVAGAITISNGSQANAIRTDSDGNLQFLRNYASNDTPTITINDETGDVGIGTTSPDYKLHVSGGVSYFPDGIATPGYHAQWTLSGGGHVSWDGLNLLWSYRIIAIPIEKTEFADQGYIEINCPISGTITHYKSDGTTGTATCTSSGVPVGSWEALWYVITPGQSQTSAQTKFVLTAYANSSWRPDSNWLLIAVKNGDSASQGGLKFMPTNSTHYTWIAPSFTDSWVNYSTQYNPCGYYKDSENRVHLRGLVKYGTTGANADIFILPTGFRPEYRHLFTVQTNGSLGRIDITDDGRVIPYTTNNTWVSLDNISFKAV